MPNIRAIDMMFLDDVFEMGGYVLKFSNFAFSRSFADEINVGTNDRRSKCGASDRREFDDGHIMGTAWAQDGHNQARLEIGIQNE
jgi:hypothetical protein